MNPLDCDLAFLRVRLYSLKVQVPGNSYKMKTSVSLEEAVLVHF